MQRLRILRFLIVFIMLGTQLLPLVALADVSVSITVTATPIITGGITDFIITYVSDTQLDLSWTLIGDAVKIMIRGKYGAYPADIPNENTTPTDGYLVYYGSGSSVSDTTMNFDENAGILYYKAWAQRADGTWHMVTSTGNKESLEVILLSFIGTILAVGFINFGFLRNSFMPYKFAGALLWVIPIVWIMSSPPSIFTVGSALQAVTLIVLIGIGLISLFGAFRKELQVNVSTTNRKTGERRDEGDIKNAWHMPTIFQNGESEEESIRKARAIRMERRAEYRDRFRQALRGPERED